MRLVESCFMGWGILPAMVIKIQPCFSAFNKENSERQGAGFRISGRVGGRRRALRRIRTVVCPFGQFASDSIRAKVEVKREK